MKRQNPLILNIDDDEAGRYVAARQLRQNGYDVIESGTGEGGFRMAQTHAPDVILLDVHLPDIDGFEVCRRLRTNPGTQGTPIIQMSASYLDTSAQAKGLENGADAYLTEPYEARMLLATIHSLLRMKNAEQTVRHSALRWQTTFDAIQDGVALLDSEGQVVQANEAFWARLGPDRGVAANLTKESFEQLRSRGKRQVTDRNVADQIFCIRLDPVFEEGALAGAVCIVQDVTEQRTFEQQLRHTAKLESIGVLAGGIAHDFNNLLTGILGNSSLIQETLPPRAPERELIAEVIKASESAADLTRQILAYSGKGRFVMQAVNLSAIALESRTFVKRFIPARVELIFRTAPDLPIINADAGQMQQLIMNLIINAAESIADGRKGTVVVRTGLEKLEAGEYVSLTVSDDGSGMDEATQQRIFDPFFTTKFAGRGLGLSAVHGIMQGHGGFVKLRSKPGDGSTFEMYFPVARDVHPKPRAVPVRTPRRASETILVVDDESVVRNFARAALESRGYRVLVAENGEEGVELFRRLHGEIDAVVLDFTMPVMDGAEALEKMRGITVKVPVVLSSGFSHSTAAERFEGKGLAGFLGKPFTIDQLTEVVEAALSSPTAGERSI